MVWCAVLFAARLAAAGSECPRLANGADEVIAGRLVRPGVGQLELQLSLQPEADLYCAAEVGCRADPKRASVAVARTRRTGATRGAVWWSPHLCLPCAGHRAVPGEPVPVSPTAREVRLLSHRT